MASRNKRKMVKIKVLGIVSFECHELDVQEVVFLLLFLVIVFMLVVFVIRTG